MMRVERGGRPVAMTILRPLACQSSNAASVRGETVLSSASRVSSRSTASTEYIVGRLQKTGG